MKASFLVDGCILAKDIFSKTDKPIVSKKTIITKEVREVLEFFLITEVSVERKLVNGETFSPRQLPEIEKEAISVPETEFTSLYLDSVQQFIKLFKGWQAGFPVDITSVRKIFIPLLELGLENKKDVFSTHHYSTDSDYLYHHLISVGLISGVLASDMNLSKGDIVQVALAGCLCDIGMSKIPQKILEKKTAPTLDEYNEIKKHPSYGYQLIKNSTTLKKTAKLAIIQHHERLDGSGYPSGEKAKNIHMFSKIVGLADIYHAMLSERIYHRKQSSYRVIETIMQDHFGKFDIEVLYSLLNRVVEISIGSTVRLSNETTGTVIFMNNRNLTRPVIKLTDGTLVDLEKNRDLFIMDTW